jgi:hypothetical protein
MKLQTKMIAVLLLVATSLSAFSVNPPDQKKNVQVLPAASGILKVLYMNEGEKKVTVKMYDASGLIYQDEVKIKDDKGFIKRYDVSQVEGTEFWIEIGDSKISTKFHVTKNGKGNFYATYWDEFTPAVNVVAAN